MLSKYTTLFLFSFSHTLKNYKALIGLSFFLTICLLIFSSLWKIVATKIGTSHLSPEQLLWYIALNEWIIISLPDIHEEIEEDLRSGKLAYLLPKPISYLGAIFSEALGALTVNLITLGFVAFVFTWFMTNSLPFSAAYLLVSILFGCMAGLVGIFFLMAIGLCAVWLHEVSPIQWLWEKFLFLLGGLMLPLTVYPKWMQTIAHFTPFPTLLADRSHLALQHSKQEVLSLFLALLIWGGIGLLLLTILYRKALRALNIGGG